MNPCPSFRADLEFVPVIQDFDRIVYVRDPLGLFPADKALPVGLFKILILLDGARNVEEVRDEISKHLHGAPLPLDAVHRVIGEFDEAYLLDTPRYRAAREPVIAAYAALPVREAALAGQAYPADPGELAALVQSILDFQAAPDSAETRTPLAVIAPHIDLGAGRTLYGRAFNQLRGARPKTVVILGVGHKLDRGLFCVTQKDFTTPLGTVKNDTALSAALAASAGQASAENDFAHKFEHSIEFQLLFLQHLLPPGSFQIVPILCGSPQLSLAEYSRQAFLDAAGPFLDTLRAAIRPDGETLVLAGVDLCHIGPKFGHMEEAEKMQRDALLHDAALLTAIVGRDPEAFWSESRKVKDRYNVCGFSALAGLLEILPPCAGNVLGHEISRDEVSASAVSFAAAVFR
jgi:hypothetical protein